VFLVFISSAAAAAAVNCESSDPVRIVARERVVAAQCAEEKYWRIIYTSSIVARQNFFCSALSARFSAIFVELLMHFVCGFRLCKNLLDDAVHQLREFQIYNDC
jgi:thiosulfate reductase cytochrome b subunit